MVKKRATTYLRRYTNLPALLHILNTSQITLFDPKSWDDKNDSHFLTQYRIKRNLGSVLALCFSQTAETYHHWRVFSPGPSGVCITFNREPLINTLNNQSGIITRDIKYYSLNEANECEIRTEDLPFIKRAAFKPEGEFRAIYESDTKGIEKFDICIDLCCIRSIALSPWIHKDLAESTIAVIHEITKNSALKVTRSTLISNEEWKALATKARSRKIQPFLLNSDPLDLATFGAD